MAIKIRLRQQGRTNQAVFRLVLAEVTSPRDGKYIEALGWYNPGKENEEQFNLKSERISHWLEHGAEMSEKAESLIARGAPAVIAAYREKRNAQRQKMVQRRREAKKKATA